MSEWRMLLSVNEQFNLNKTSFSYFPDW